jgi:hypothetical protein
MQDVRQVINPVAQVIGPDNDAQQAFQEIGMEKPEGKEPADKPQRTQNDRAVAAMMVMVMLMVVTAFIVPVLFVMLRFHFF